MTIYLYSKKLVGSKCYHLGWEQNVAIKKYAEKTLLKSITQKKLLESFSIDDATLFLSSYAHLAFYCSCTIGEFDLNLINQIFQHFYKQNSLVNLGAKRNLKSVYYGILSNTGYHSFIREKILADKNIVKCLLNDFLECQEKLMLKIKDYHKLSEARHKGSRLGSRQSSGTRTVRGSRKPSRERSAGGSRDSISLMDNQSVKSRNNNPKSNLSRRSSILTLNRESKRSKIEKEKASTVVFFKIRKFQKKNFLKFLEQKICTLYLLYTNH